MIRTPSETDTDSEAPPLANTIRGYVFRHIFTDGSVKYLSKNLFWYQHPTENSAWIHTTDPDVMGWEFLPEERAEAIFDDRRIEGERTVLTGPWETWPTKEVER